MPFLFSLFTSKPKADDPSLPNPIHNIERMLAEDMKRKEAMHAESMSFQKESSRIQQESLAILHEVQKSAALVQQTALQQRGLDIVTSGVAGIFIASNPIKTMQSRFGAIEAMTIGPIFIRKIASTLAKYPRPAAFCATGAIVCFGALSYAAASSAIDGKASRKVNRGR